MVETMASMEEVEEVNNMEGNKVEESNFNWTRFMYMLLAFSFAIIFWFLWVLYKLYKMGVILQ